MKPPKTVKRKIESAIEALQEIKCHMCHGSGRKTWHRRDICECSYCNGTGILNSIRYVMNILEKP